MDKSSLDFRCTEGVFVLGAGFSRAISEALPLTQDLGMELSSRFDVLPPPDVESWLSYLADDQPFLRIDENLSNRALFHRSAQHIAEVIVERETLALQAPPADWLIQLALLWSRRSAQIVTFNYDTLLEAVASWIGDYHLRDTRSARLLKLHGSVDESWDPVDPASVLRSPQVAGPSWVRQDPTAEAPWQMPGRFHPFIVPPVTIKSPFYKVPELRDRWLRAAGALRGAPAVVLMGYSIPEADFATAALITGGIKAEAYPGANRKYVLVADMNALAVEDRLKRLGISEVDYALSGPDSICEMVQVLCMLQAKRTLANLEGAIQSGLISRSQAISLQGSFVATPDDGAGDFEDPSLVIRDHFIEIKTVGNLCEYLSAIREPIDVGGRRVIEVAVHGDYRGCTMIVAPTQQELWARHPTGRLAMPAG